MEKRITDEVRDEPGEPMVAKSKMGDATVSEREVKGIENLTPIEKRHLLLQLARDKVKKNSVGPWEITDIRREEWRTVKAILTQPVEIDVKDTGRDVLFEVFLDITQLERELEAEKVEVDELETQKRKTIPRK